jgi:hypothetical protein
MKRRHLPQRVLSLLSMVLAMGEKEASKSWSIIWICFNVVNTRTLTHSAYVGHKELELFFKKNEGFGQHGRKISSAFGYFRDRLFYR